jgi:hypothetical protein
MKFVHDFHAYIFIVLPNYEFCLFSIIWQKPFNPLWDSALAHVPIYIPVPQNTDGWAIIYWCNVNTTEQCKDQMILTTDDPFYHNIFIIWGTARESN